MDCQKGTDRLPFAPLGSSAPNRLCAWRSAIAQSGHSASALVATNVSSQRLQRVNPWRVSARGPGSCNACASPAGCNVKAWCGQRLSHRPQATHSSAWKSNPTRASAPSTSASAPLGQADAHTPSCVHWVLACSDAKVAAVRSWPACRASVAKTPAWRCSDSRMVGDGAQAARVMPERGGARKAAAVAAGWRNDAKNARRPSDAVLAAGCVANGWATRDGRGTLSMRGTVVWLPWIACSLAQAKSRILRVLLA